jgi:hypothetical protein
VPIVEQELLTLPEDQNMTNAPSMYKVIPWAAPLKFIPLSNLNII